MIYSNKLLVIICNKILNFYLKTEFSYFKIQIHYVIAESTKCEAESIKIHFSEFINNIIYIINCIASIRIDFAFGEGFVTSFETTIYSNLTISGQKIVI